MQCPAYETKRITLFYEIDIFSVLPGEVNTSLKDLQIGDICMLIARYIHIMYSENLKIKEGIVYIYIYIYIYI